MVLAALALAMPGGAAAEGPVYGEAPVYAPAPEGGSMAGSMRIGWVKLNRRSGRAVLFVRVGGPGRLFLWGRGVRRLRRGAERAKLVRLPVKPKVRLQHYLKRRGKARIRVKVTFTPLTGIPRTQEKLVALKRKRAR
ncbi:MAG: hypothetical protein WD404_05295 [Solirubrobacterales bacterium]